MLHNYPKSSCSCFDCDKKKFKVPTGLPTNMSVPGCNFSNYYECHSKRPFKIHEEPKNKRVIGNYILNPDVYAKNKFDQTMKPINSDECPGSACPGTTYISGDPRLFDAPRSMLLQLDNPPLNSTPKLNTLYDNKKLDCYGQGYKSYSDVTAGQILYYVPHNLEDAFFEPLFSKKAYTVGTMYKDPMGSLKPQYDRVQFDNKDPLQNTCNIKNEYCLSWMDDSQAHREDILSKQMQKINQERYAPRWTNIKE